MLPGEPADYTGFLINHTGQVVTLKSARLLPLRGFRPPRLVHLAIEPGKDFAAADSGWPPSTEGRDHIQPFAGARIPSGNKRVNILYAVAATKLGDYGDAGIRVTVLAGGTLATVDVLSVAGTCVVPSRKITCPVSFQNRITNAAG
ncbi:MAG: hypothetical protein ACLP7J_12400 [Streptosporangiaceae bacterium]